MAERMCDVRETHFRPPQDIYTPWNTSCIMYLVGVDKAFSWCSDHGMDELTTTILQKHIFLEVV